MRPIPFIGGESYELPMFTYVWERTIDTAVDWQDEVRGKLEWTNADAHFDRRFPLSYSFTWESAGRGHLPPLSTFSDSYGEAFWRTGMHFYFDKVYSFRFNSPGVTLTSTLRRLPPDARYFVLQFLEIELPRVGEVDWPQLGAPVARR